MAGDTDFAGEAAFPLLPLTARLIGDLTGDSSFGAAGAALPRPRVAFFWGEGDFIAAGVASVVTLTGDVGFLAAALPRRALGDGEAFTGEVFFTGLDTTLALRPPLVTFLAGVAFTSSSAFAGEATSFTTLSVSTIEYNG